MADLRILGLRGVVAARRLTGGRSDRTWRVDTASGSWVLHRRASDPGRGAGGVAREQRCTGSAALVGAGPEVVAVDDARGLLLTRWIPGRALTAARLGDADVLASVARTVGTLHGAPVPRHRVRTSALHARYFREAVRADGSHAGLLIETRPLLAALTVALIATTPATVLVHGDLVPGNIVLGSHGMFLVDYEFAGAGEPAYDLGNLVAGCALDARGTQRLVREYNGGPSAGGVDALRVRAWSRVLQGAWIAWVDRGQDLGTARAQWTTWADSAARGLRRSSSRGELRDLLAALE